MIISVKVKLRKRTPIVLKSVSIFADQRRNGRLPLRRHAKWKDSTLEKLWSDQGTQYQNLNTQSAWSLEHEWEIDWYVAKRHPHTWHYTIRNNEPEMNRVSLWVDVMNVVRIPTRINSVETHDQGWHCSHIKIYHWPEEAINWPKYILSNRMVRTYIIRPDAKHTSFENVRTENISGSSEWRNNEN